MASEAITRNDLTEILDKVLPICNGMIVKKSFSKSGLSYSTYYGLATFDIGLTGYTPIALSGVSLNQAILHTYSTFITNATTCTVGVSRPTSSGTISSLMITVEVVYIKNAFVGTLS